MRTVLPMYMDDRLHLNHAVSFATSSESSGVSIPALFFFFSSRRRHTRCGRDWSSDVCSSDLPTVGGSENAGGADGIEDETCRICRRGSVFDGREEPGSLPGQPIYGVIPFVLVVGRIVDGAEEDRKSTRLNSSHVRISYAVFCL